MLIMKYKICLCLLLGVATKAFQSVSFSPSSSTSSFQRIKPMQQLQPLMFQFPQHITDSVKKKRSFASSSSSCLYAVEIMTSSVDLASATAAAAAVTTSTATSMTATAAAAAATSSSFGPVALFDDFLRSQPFLSAFMMCGFKASAADLLAQTSESEQSDDTDNSSESETSSSSSVQHFTSSLKQLKKKDDTINDNRISNTISHYHDLIMNMIQTQFHQHNEVHHDDEDENEQINVARNFAFLLYGGLYQGMFLQLLYMVVYPFLYGDSAFRIPLCVCTDVFMFGPFVTLPIAYIIRAVIDNLHQDDVVEEERQHYHLQFTKTTSTTTTTTSSTFQEAMLLGIDKYKNHIVTQDLLIKYWSIWAPAQSINNIFVPEHLRVFFVAFISFFWVFLLSIISNQESTANDGEGAMNGMKHEPARQTS